MKCFTHQTVDAVGACKSCGKGLCPSCAVDLHFALSCRGDCESELSASHRETHPRPWRATWRCGACPAISAEGPTLVEKSWFASAARERRIPFRKLGRYVRFSFQEVMECEAVR